MDCYKLKNIQRRLGDFHLKIDDLSFKKGGIYSIIGPNGGGKTSFFNILSLLDKPCEGSLFFQGESIMKYNSKKLLPLRRKIGYLLQNMYLFNMTVHDNIAYGLRLRKIPYSQINKRVSLIAEMLSLTSLLNKNVKKLSGGEAQKVGLARTLVLDAEVFLLDEPTGNIDKKSVNVIEEAILSLNKVKGATVFVTTHSRDQAYRLSSNVVLIANGEVKKNGRESLRYQFQ